MGRTLTHGPRGCSGWPRLTAPSPRVVLNRSQMVPDDPALHLLVVERDDRIAAQIDEVLRAWPHAEFVTVRATTVAEATDHLADELPDAVVLDLPLQRVQGLETLLRVRSLAPRAAVVVLSGEDEERLARDVIRAGAQDVIAHTVEGLDRLPRVITWACERQRRLIDILDQALRDELTGLSNRRGLHTLVEHLMALQRRAGLALTVLYLDLNGFKTINDAYGHDVGDLVLRRFAQLLRASYRESDVIARVGGDEYVVVLIDDHRADPSDRLREAFLAAVDEEVFPPELGFAAGVATTSAPTSTVAFVDLLRQADDDMYQQKVALAEGTGGRGVPGHDPVVREVRLDHQLVPSDPAVAREVP